jgi:GTP-binding protein
MEGMDLSNPHFLLSVHNLKQLPAPGFPEVAFAGRSNVGKSSCINTLLRRRNLVKVSGRPGKTQGLNYFQVGLGVYFVDLPGYGYAKVDKGMQIGWQSLITTYLETRPTLACVVIVLDIRHPPKDLDSQLINWLRMMGIGVVAVYTKADKLSGNLRKRNAEILDTGHTIRSDERILFSAKTGQGRDDLEQAICTAIQQKRMSGTPPGTAG